MPDMGLVRILAVIALRAGVIAGLLWLFGVVLRWSLGVDVVGMLLWVAAALTVLQVGMVVVIFWFCRPGGPLDRAGAPR